MLSFFATRIFFLKPILCSFFTLQWEREQRIEQHATPPFNLLPSGWLFAEWSKDLWYTDVQGFCFLRCSIFCCVGAFFPISDPMHNWYYHGHNAKKKGISNNFNEILMRPVKIQCAIYLFLIIVVWIMYFVLRFSLFMWFFAPILCLHSQNIALSAFVSNDEFHVMFLWWAMT